MISILEKRRAPSRIEFRRGLWFETPPHCRRSFSALLLGVIDHATGDQHEPDGDAQRVDGVDLVVDEPVPHESTDPHQLGDDPKDPSEVLHRLSSFKVQFSTALLPERLAVSCDSDNIANIAYMGLKVKPNRKSLYLKAFSRFQDWIKKFSSPKIKIWFEPMFFYGFFCGFGFLKGSDNFKFFFGGN